MDEYIKREDALDAVLFALTGTGHQSRAINAIRDVPAADVIPKGEIEISQYLLKDAWKRIEELDNLCGELQKSKSEVSREIFEEIDNLFDKYPTLRNIGGVAIAELKKKYIER